MRTLTVSLLGAAAVAASLLLLKQQREVVPMRDQAEAVPAGEKVPARISLERLRELGY